MTLPATKRDVMLTASSEAQRSEAANVMDAIVRLTQSPQFNPEAVERMVALWERVRDREAETAFNEAMALVQEEMQPVRKDANNPQTRSKYASYHALDQAIRPIYTKHGFALSFDTGETSRENEVLMLCYVTRGGYTRTYRLLMPADGKGAKGGEVMTRTHAVGSATKYGMRYQLGMIWNIATSEDDDGNAAGRTRPAPPRPATESPFITPLQLDELSALLDYSPERMRQFCEKYLQCPLAQMRAPAFEGWKRFILDVNAKRARQATQAPADSFQPQGEGYMPPKLKRASTGYAGPSHPGYEVTIGPDTKTTVVESGPIDNRNAGTWVEFVDGETGEVTAPPRPTQRPRPPRPVQSVAVTSQSPSVGTTAAPATTASGSDLPWEDQVNALVENAPDFSMTNINALMKWQQRLFELMPDKETAAETHWEHIRERLKDIPHPANADALQGAWNLLMKRFD